MRYREFKREVENMGKGVRVDGEEGWSYWAEVWKVGCSE